MEKIKVNIPIKYWEPFLPSPRHRKYRYREEKTTITVSVDSISEEPAPIAFMLSDYSHVQNNKTVFRLYKQRLFTRMNMTDTKCYYGEERDRMLLQGLSSDKLPNLILQNSNIFRSTIDLDELPETRTKLRHSAKQFVIINGQLWKQTGEPRYEILTFGLGHNHGGTGLFVETMYNSNVPNKNYFSALDEHKAVAYANEIAKKRGDTKNVGTFKKMIEVLIPEAVKVNPTRQHGKGDPFINQLNAITEKSNSATEAGLLSIISTMSQIETKK